MGIEYLSNVLQQDRNTTSNREVEQRLQGTGSTGFSTVDVAYINK